MLLETSQDVLVLADVRADVIDPVIQIFIIILQTLTVAHGLLRFLLFLRSLNLILLNEFHKSETVFFKLSF